MKRILLPLLLCFWIFSSACATLFLGPTQKIKIMNPSDQVSVYVDQEETHTPISSRNIMELKKNGNIRQLRIEREGYLSEYTVAYPKLSPVFGLNYGFIPLGAGIGAVAFEASEDFSPGWIGAGVGLGLTWIAGFVEQRKSERSRVYKKKLYITEPNAKLLDKGEDQKYLFSQAIKVELQAKDFTFKAFSKERSKNKADIFAEDTNLDDIKLDNTIFTQSVNALLKQTGFADTTSSVLRDLNNTNYLNGSLVKLEINQSVPRYGNGSYFTAELSIEWELTDFYNTSLYSTTLSSYSGRFSTAYFQDSAITKSVAHAIQRSMLKLLAKEEVQEQLFKDQNFSPTYAAKEDYLSLNKPQNTPIDLRSAIHASVTVKVDEGHGSGLFITEDGFVLTNHHVIAGSEHIMIIAHDKQEFPATVIRSNKEHDLALLKVDREEGKAFLLPGASNYGIGKTIFTIGTPQSLDLGQTLSRGIISGERERGENKDKIFQTDASINFGNSGGPIVSDKGELLGVVNAKLVGFGVEGIAFGIPAYLIMEYLGLEYNDN